MLDSAAALLSHKSSNSLIIFSFSLQANKIGLTPFFCHNGDHLTTPPPAHCGIPAYQLDPKTMGEFCEHKIIFYKHLLCQI